MAQEAKVNRCHMGGGIGSVIEANVRNGPYYRYSSVHTAYVEVTDHYDWEPGISDWAMICFSDVADSR
jgi:hypothetical protein